MTSVLDDEGGLDTTAIDISTSSQTKRSGRVLPDPAALDRSETADDDGTIQLLGNVTRGRVK